MVSVAILFDKIQLPVLLYSRRFDGVLNSVIGLIVEKRPMLYIGLPVFITFLIGVFFGILLLQYNPVRSFSLAYAMLVLIFMILGAIGLFMGLTFHVIARLKESEGKK